MHFHLNYSFWLLSDAAAAAVGGCLRDDATAAAITLQLLPKTQLYFFNLIPADARLNYVSWSVPPSFNPVKGPLGCRIKNGDTYI